MTNTRYFLLAGVLAFIGVVGVSCSIYGENYPIVTLTPMSATQPPTDISSSTPLPLPTFAVVTYPTAIPYPTASVVKANAVAFIAENALWVANVDGSGERKLTDIQNNESWTSSYLLKWSPDGKWIGYISGNGLWVISPDGSTSRKVIEVSEADNKNKIRSYSWSPDGSEIAYIQTIKGRPIPRLLNLGTGDVSDLLISTDQLSLSWSPDGRHILLNTYESLTIFEVVTSKVLKEINSACPIWHGGPVWSPDNKWFYHLVFANGTYGLRICLSGLDGSIWQIEDVGSAISQPVWDKTGDYLYFVDGEMNLDIGANWFTNQRLVRYNVKTRKVEDLLSLEEDGSTGYPPTVFLSPNGKMLGLYSYIWYENNLRYVDASRPKKNKFVILDIHSLSMAKYTLEFEGEVAGYFPTWSPDNQKIVFFLKNLVRESYGISYSDYGSFYSLDIKTGKVSLFSGVHAIEKAIISPISTTP